VKKIIWKTEKRKLSELHPWERNPRQATDKQAQDLSKSLDKFNLADPLIVNTDNTIIGGHFRYKILKEKQIEEIDVRMPDRKLTDKEIKELNIRLNKNLGSWNFDELANFDEEILKDIGFENDELDEIFGLDMDEDFDIEKEFEKVVKNPKGVKEGEIWQLGEKHRLYIGDACEKESWEKVLENEKFDLCFTDPPYNLAYAKKSWKIKVKTKEGLRFKEKGFGYKGNRLYQGTKKLGKVPEYDEWLSIANEFQNQKGANIMIFENWRNTHDLWEAIEKYWKIKNLIIWHLPNRHQGFSRPGYFFQKYDIAPLAGEGVLNEEYEKELDDYLQEKGQKLLDSYEVILYGQKGKSEWGKRKGTKWAKISDHITSQAETLKGSGDAVIFGKKPIQILIPYIKILSPRDGIVMEPFAGSGSTIIASEIMKRKCRAIEIAPIYGEIILRRWEKFTGKKAKKIK